MALRDTFLNMLGVETPEVQKTSNGAIKSARDFLRYGNREKLYPSWSDIQMPDSDMYRGYSYAVIQKRGNKVASLAKNNLKTWAKQEIVDEYQKREEQVLHPYLKIIEDSTKFTEKQFWKNISIYLDLAGRYYLGVIRNEIKPLNPKLPVITTDPTEFVMLNPYEIRRVIDKNGNVAGYIERKKDGRYREWPLFQIIEMRELNPFDPENGQWAMTDAAKSAVYTINQSSDYTKQSLNGNIDAPGIITTDVLLTDEDFANFRARVTQHVKGEPLFGNGTGAIKWDSMQVDLDKAALMDINEINRTELFAVSGTSKTSLGIEQSGTTRETARVQSEQFISDTAQPRLEDIVDFLNLDYKKYYTREYKKTGYTIEVESAVGRDYDTETKATALKQTQFQLAMQLIQSGYTTQSAYQFAEGNIEFEDLELEKGLDKPKNPEQPEEGLENNPTGPQKGPQSGSGSGNGNNNVPENNSLENAINDLSELEPHSDLVENGGKGSENLGKLDEAFKRKKNNLEGEDRLPLTINGGEGSGNFGHLGRPGLIGGSSKGGYRGISFSKSAEESFKEYPNRKKEFDQVIEEFRKIGLKRGFHFTMNAFDVAAKGEGFFDVGKYSGRTVTETAEGGSTVYVSPTLLKEGIGKKSNFEKDGKTYEVDDTFAGVLRHELGHLFMTQLFLTEYKGKVSGDLNQSAFDRYNRDILFNSKCNRPFLGGKWSYYADMGSGEAIAEAFSNPDYSEDTKKVFNYVKNYNPKKNSLEEYQQNSTKENVIVACIGYPVDDEALKEYMAKVEKNQCTCGHEHKVETFINEVREDEAKIVSEEYKDFLAEVRKIEKETIDAVANKLTINAFEPDDIITPKKKKSLLEKLKNAIHNYWWIIFPLFASNSMSKRNEEFDEDIEFVFNNDLQTGVDDNAERVAEGHLETILKDILDASNRAYTKVVENAAAEVIIKVYDENPEKLSDYFDEKPTMADALESIQKTDILEENRKIYEKANKMAFEGFKREDIVKAIRNEYSHISETRATLIARNETARAFGRSQFEADKQFLNSIGKMEQAYKVWYSRRPESEKDKICAFCQELIDRSNANPIPFEEPFLKYGDSMEVVENGKVKIFTANYEDIEGGTLHPNCACGYHLVFKNSAGEFVKTLNGGKGSGNFGHSGRPGLIGGSSDKNTPNPLGSEYRRIIDNFNTSDFTDEEKKLIKDYYIAFSVGNSDLKNNNQSVPERMWLVPKEEFFDREDFTVDSKTYYEQAEEFLKKYPQSSYDEKDIEWRKAIAEGYVSRYKEALEVVNQNKASYLFTLPEAHKFVDGDIQLVNLLKYMTEDTTTRFIDMPDETLRKLIKPYKYTSDFMPEMFESEIKGRKLDKTITEKGISFDKDIVVVRRVPTREKIDRQIEKQGFYQQEGFTSTSAGKNIAKKTPGGHILGDNLYRITIPAGTKVLPIEPFLDENSSGLKNQRELLLPQKTRFVKADNGTDLVALTKNYWEKNNG